MTLCHLFAHAHVTIMMDKRSNEGREEGGEGVPIQIGYVGGTALVDNKQSIDKTLNVVLSELR